MTERGTAPVRPGERERLARHVDRIGGVPPLVHLTGIPSRTIQRALAGLPLRADSRIILQEGLRELEAARRRAGQAIGEETLARLLDEVREIKRTNRGCTMRAKPPLGRALEWFVAVRPLILRAMWLGTVIWLATNCHWSPVWELLKRP
jgi:hypothetical protein